MEVAVSEAEVALVVLLPLPEMEIVAGAGLHMLKCFPEGNLGRQRWGW